MQVHEPLLDAELGLRGASNTHLWRGAIEHHRALATLTLSPDGSFQLKEVGNIFMDKTSADFVLLGGCFRCSRL